MSRFVSLAAERLAELAERCAEGGRLSRGRALFRKGSVSDLSVVEGSLIASVRGSQGDRYEATIGTELAPPGVIRQMAQAFDAENRWSVDDLIGDGLDVCPREMDLGFACECADWEEPCKHVVAVLLAFADRVDLDESELLRWRGIDLSGPVSDESEDRSRTQSPRRHRPWAGASARSRSAIEPRSPSGSGATDRSAVDGSGDRTARLSELEALLGDTVMRVTPADGSEPDRQASALEPALAEFLGVGMVLEPLAEGGLGAPAPLFADVQLGPLADLGPELASALATIIARLDDPSGP